jgi:hypothetical protein
VNRIVQIYAEPMLSYATRAMIVWFVLAIGVIGIATGTFAGNGTTLAKLAFVGDVICTLAALVAGAVAFLRIRSTVGHIVFGLAIAAFAAVDVIVTLVSGGVASGDYRG